MAEFIQYTDQSIVNTQDKLDIVLSNALCCSSEFANKVAKMYLLGNKCADSELRKLKLLIDKIKLLRKYKFNGDPVNSEFESLPLGEAYVGALTTPIGLFDDSSQQVTVNGVSYPLIADGTSNLLELVIAKLQELNAYVSHELIAGIEPIYNFVLTCDITDFSFSITKDLEKTPYTIDYPFTNIVLGDCVGPQYINCITEEQMDKLTHDIMRECDICDCELT